MDRRRHATSEPRAFEELVSANLDALYRTALRLCAARRADAEDLLQDAVLRAFEHREDLRDARAGRSWLFTILVRTSLNRARTQRRRREAFTEDLGEAAFEEALATWRPTPSADERLDHIDTRERLAAALDRLDPLLRAVVLLADVEGFSQRETAAMLDVPEGTVASRLFRARRALRDSLLLSEDRPARARRAT